jgi:hypothetical protein
MNAANHMASAARRLLDALDEDKRARAWFEFPGEPARSRWNYTPGDHGGLELTDCTAEQRQAALRLLAAGLSPPGYAAAAAIMAHELILERLEDWPIVPGAGRVRDPLLYSVAVYGDPAGGDWGWRFSGHHLSVHYTIAGGELASPTPSFFGADPAESPLPGGGLLRPCGVLEDLGRQLARSLDESQLASALLSPQPPPEILTGNRAVLTDGPGGLPACAGLSSARLSPGQHEMLAALLGAYLERLPDDCAERERAKVLGPAAGELHFGWAGGLEPRHAHYYRIQGARLLVEYDNYQRDANHVHTVWRDPVGDFGRDILAEHYAASHR